MFPNRKRIVHLQVNGQVIRTTADHPLYVEGKGWVNAADMPGAQSEGQNLGEQTMPHFPILGFAAGTPLLTPEGHKPIEELHPGDFLQSGPDGEQPDDGQGDGAHDGPEPPRWWERN